MTYTLGFPNMAYEDTSGILLAKEECKKVMHGKVDFDITASNGNSLKITIISKKKIYCLETLMLSYVFETEATLIFYKGESPINDLMKMFEENDKLVVKNWDLLLNAMAGSQILYDEEPNPSYFLTASCLLRDSAQANGFL